MIRRLRFTDFADPGDAYHFARVALPEAPTGPGHRHDFQEIFWVEQGEGIHLVNGQRRTLKPGMCVCIRAPDAHTLRARPGQSPVRIVNVAFPVRCWQRLRRRYFSGRPDFFAGPVARREFSISPAELSAAATDLSRGPRSELKIERFLINLFYALSAEKPGTEGPTLIQDWLQRACRLIRENRAFAGGVPAFARLAGRCPGHLARQVRRHMDKTPTDIVNEARLAFAAEQLMDGRPAIAEIALDCGIENLSHFYSLFRRHFGCTPRQYRLRHQRIVN